MPLSNAEKKELRARAHALDPVVRVGGGGVSEGVLGAIDAALESHELIKIRFLSDDRIARAGDIETVLAATRAESVLAIGKMLTIHRKRRRKNPEDDSGRSAAR